MIHALAFFQYRSKTVEATEKDVKELKEIFNDRK
jgi:hypothetical protein